MTATGAPPQAETAAPASGGDGDGDGQRPRRGGASPWWRYGFPVAMVLLVLAIPALVYAGSQVVLGSSEGRSVQGVTDPAAPGWEAVVDPTPLLALAVLDLEGELDHLVVLTLTGEGVGGVVVLPGDTVMGVPGIGNIPLSIVYASQGPEVVQQGLTGILGLGVPDLRVVRAGEWDDLVEPVGPLSVTNVDEVVATDAAGVTGVAFPKGQISLPAGRVAEYLTVPGDGQSDLSRMIRVEAFWRAWLAAVAADPDSPTIVPGEVDSGLGRFVRTLARGQAEVTELPVLVLRLEDGSGEVYEPIPEAVVALMGQLVPFPAGPEGARVRIRVLDGTGQLDHGLGAAALMAGAGAQIDKVGNAPQFGVEVTTFTYYDDAALSRVERLREALGVGEIVRSDELNAAADATVVLGTDYLEARRDAGVPGVATTGSTDGDSGG